MKRVLAALALSTLACSSSLFAANGDIFVEKDGVVMMEVESMPAASGWTETTDIGGYLGSSYFVWTGPNHFSSGAAGNGTVKYTFRINTPGNYQMRWRNRITQGSSNTEHNDSWVRMASGQDIDGEHALSGWTKVYMNQQNNWTWDSRTVDHVGDPVRQYFHSGDHTLEISGRSAGHAIDRIALYRYEDVNYSTSKFNGLNESQITRTPWEGGDPEPQPEPEPEPEPEPQPEPEPEKPDWSINRVTQNANTCEGNVISLSPSADLYLQNNIVTDSDDLKINAANRTTLLQFDLSVVPRPLDEASLVVSVGSDAGSGPIIISSGDHSDWSERDTGFNRPDSSILLGSFDGDWDSNKHYELPLDPALLGAEAETLILEMSAGSNDVSLKSRSTANGPRLQLRGSAGLCSGYNALVAEAELQAQTEEPEEVPTEPETENPEPETPEPENPEPETPDTGDKDETGNPSTDDIASSLGAAPLLGMLLLGFTLWRRQTGQQAC